MNGNRDYRELICHGKEERCIKFGRKVMPICARCFGVYTGLGIGFIFGLLLNISYLSSTLLFFLTIFAVIPVGIDGLLQELSNWDSKNEIRIVTGGTLGILLGLDIVWIALESNLF